MNNQSTSTQTGLNNISIKKPKNKSTAYRKLKKDLITICSKIEESFDILLHNKSLIQKDSYSPKAVKKEKNECALLIKEYKSKIKDVELELETVMKMGKVLEIEGELLSKEKLYYQLKKENDTLNSIRLHHVKGLEDYQKKILKRNEIVTIQENNKKTKEEIKIKRNYYRTTESQIQSQLNKIKVLEEKYKIIQDNIEYQKEKAAKEMEMSIKRNEKKSEENEYLYEEDIDKLKELAKLNENNYFQLQNEYKKAIEEQRNKIERIKEENKILTQKIYQIDQQRKLQELINKEKKKKEELDEIQKSQKYPNFRKKFNQNIKPLNNKKRTSNVNFSLKKRPSKPFEINKVLNEQNNCRSQNITKDETLLQIEELKLDIQKAISQNDRQIRYEFNKPPKSSLNNITEIKHMEFDDINISNYIDNNI